MTTARSNSRPSTRFDSLEQEAFLNLWRTYDRLRAIEDEFFGTFSLTAQQYNILRLLKAQHPQTAATLEIAERLVSRAPDITRMLDRLEQRDLIGRSRSAVDRRTVDVGITAAGVALLKKIAPGLKQCHARQLGHIPVAQLKQAITLLEAMRAPHEGSESSWR